MRTKEEILKAIEMLKRCYPDIEDIPEYVRGQYAMLKWVLDEKGVDAK